MLFLSAGITDFSSSKASMWVTAVPCTAVFTILGAAAVPPVVAAGDVAAVNRRLLPALLAQTDVLSVMPGLSLEEAFLASAPDQR